MKTAVITTSVYICSALSVCAQVGVVVVIQIARDLGTKGQGSLLQAVVS